MIAALMLSSALLQSCPKVLTPAVARTVLSVDPNLVHAIIENESAGNPNAVSSAGAVGLGQLMSGTAKSVDVCDRRDPVQNVIGTARYLAYLIGRYSDIRLVVSAYNAGPGAVDRYHDTPPFPETIAYVHRVLASYARFSSETSGDGTTRPGAAQANPTPRLRITPHPAAPPWPNYGQRHVVFGDK